MTIEDYRFSLNVAEAKPLVLSSPQKGRDATRCINTEDSVITLAEKPSIIMNMKQLYNHIISEKGGKGKD